MAGRRDEGCTKGGTKAREPCLERGNAVLRKDVLTNRFVLTIFIFTTRDPSQMKRGNRPEGVAAGIARATRRSPNAYSL